MFILRVTQINQSLSDINTTLTPKVIILKQNPIVSDYIVMIRYGNLIVVDIQCYETFTANAWKEITLSVPSLPYPLHASNLNNNFGIVACGDGSGVGVVQVIIGSKGYNTLRFAMEKSGTYMVRGQIIYIASN